MARAAVRAAAAGASASGTRLADSISRELVDDIFAHALKKQTGVSLKYMVSEWGSPPGECRVGGAGKRRRRVVLCCVQSNRSNRPHHASPLPPPKPTQLDFGANPIERQLVLSAQFLQKELPVRLAHRVAELENLPYGLSSKPQVLKVSGLIGI